MPGTASQIANAWPWSAADFAVLLGVSAAMLARLLGGWDGGSGSDGDSDAGGDGGGD